MTRLIHKRDGRIDWPQSATEIERRVRAMQPWPVATAVHAGTVLKIWRARAVRPERPGVPPGPVAGSEGRLLVACGADTALEILELQRPGGRRLPAAEFLRGFDLAAGSRFAPVDGASD